jgi:hypothetical protein
MSALSSKDMCQLLNNTSSMMTQKGKGKGLPALKGNGKGKPGLLALLDKGRPPKDPVEKSPEQMLDDALTKAKKMRDLASNAVTSMEEQINLTKKSKFWSKAAQKEADEQIQKLSEAALTMKKFLQKQNITDPDLVKGRIMECGIAVKVAQSQIREYKQLLMKASSVAGSSKSKKK